ncbi:MAG: beta strand repeat-containing protein, partial [Planctomycetota bacterium]
DTTQEDPQTILGSNANLNAGDVITGGPEDTLVLSLDGALPGDGGYNFAGFTIDGVGTVQVTNDSGQTVSLDMSNSDDVMMSNSDDVMTLVSQNSTADLEFNFVNTNDGDVNLKVLNLTDGVNVTLDVRNDDAAATDNEVNLQVTDSDDDGEDADTITIDEDMEIVNLSTMDSSGEVSITTLVTEGAHTLNIDTDVDLTIDDPLSSSVDSVYAGSATGDLDLDTSGNDTGALIVSGSGDDLFTTGDGGDTVYAGAGDDSIYAGSGANLVYGEDGMDTINALSGNDTLWGGANDDVINAGDGNNQAWGGAGDDDITVGTGNDIVVAAEGDDYIDITAGGEDNVSGGDDDDVVDAGSSLSSSFTEDLGDNDNGGDTLDGGAGDDVLNIDSSNPDGNFLDRVTNFETINIDGEDNLTVTITDSSDFDHDTTETVIDASGMTGDLTFEGNDLAPNSPPPDDESVSPFTGIDDDVLSRSITIIGGSGDDRIVTGLGEDEITGNTGDDSIYTGAGNDTVNGAVGDDSIYMEAGDDLLIVQGGELDGDDYEIDGGSGDDTIQLINPSQAAGTPTAITAVLGNEVSGIQTLEVVDNDGSDDNTITVTVTGDYTNLEPGGAGRSVLAIDGSELDAGETLRVFTQGQDGDGDGIDEDFNISGGGAADQFWMGNNLDAGDTIDGGDNVGGVLAGLGDVIASTGSGTGSDASFTNVSNVETYLYEAVHSATLGQNAQAAGIRLVLGTNGGNDTLNASGYTEGLTVLGRGGDDLLVTGSGEDTVSGGGEDDSISTNAGDDTVIMNEDGADGNDSIYMGADNDTLIVRGTVLDDGDTVDGGSGYDTIELQNFTDHDDPNNSPAEAVALIDLDQVTSIEEYNFVNSDNPADDPYDFVLMFVDGDVGTLTTINVDASDLAVDDDGDQVVVDISGVADVDFAFNVTGHDGTDVVIGNSNFAENLNFHGNGGEDYLAVDGADLGTTITANGGDGDDVLAIMSGNLTDDSFVDVDDFEILWGVGSQLDEEFEYPTGSSDGVLNAVLGQQAENTGITTIIGGVLNDSVVFDPAFNPAAVTVNLSAGGDDTINAGASTSTVTFVADASDIDANDVLVGGSGSGDSIELTADNGQADLRGGVLTNVAQVNVVEGTGADGDDSIAIWIDDATFAGTGGTITVDASALNDTPSATPVNPEPNLPEGSFWLLAGGVGEDNDLVVHGGNGDDSIYTGAGDDFIDVNLGNDFVDSGAGDDEIVNNGGNNTVIAGSGNDSVDLGGGNNYVDAGSGADSVYTGAGNDTVMGGSGNDVLSTGSGYDWVSGGAGSDTITVLPGTLAGPVDEVSTVTGGGSADTINIVSSGSVILRYENVSDSDGSGGGTGRDTITGFSGDDVIRVETQATAAGVNTANFAGNAADFTDAIGAISITANDGKADYVFQQDKDLLWIDVNDDGQLNGLDIQINLAGTAAISGGQVSVVDTIAPVFNAPDFGPVASLDENSGAGQVVYDANASDYGGVTFSLGGPDTGAFGIDPNTGVVTLTGDPNFEGQSSYSYSVIATDGAANSSQVDLTLAVNNLDEQSPNITSSSTPSVDENVGAGTIVHTVVADDSADISAGVTYSITGGADAGQFTIDSSTGELTLLANPDFEGQASYTVDVAADDGVTAPDTQTITLSVNDKDETAPNIAALASPYAFIENTDASTVVFTVSATDPASDSGDGPSNPVTYSLSGADAGFLTIDADDGEVRFNASPDHESKAVYNFNVVATDAAGNAAVAAAVVNITDLDEVAPDWDSTPGGPIAINENTGAQVIFDFDATDNEEA